VITGPSGARNSPSLASSVCQLAARRFPTTLNALPHDIYTHRCIYDPPESAQGDGPGARIRGHHRRGEVIARIVPASSGPLDALISAGKVQRATVRGRAPRPTIPMRGGPDAGALLERMRAEERY